MYSLLIHDVFVNSQLLNFANVKRFAFAGC